MKCGWVSDVTASIAKLEVTHAEKSEPKIVKNSRSNLMPSTDEPKCSIHTNQPRGMLMIIKTFEVRLRYRKKHKISGHRTVFFNGNYFCKKTN